MRVISTGRAACLWNTLEVMPRKRSAMTGIKARIHVGQHEAAFTMVPAASAPKRPTLSRISLRREYLAADQPEPATPDRAAPASRGYGIARLLTCTRPTSSASARPSRWSR